jgi:hypothetical protein
MKYSPLAVVAALALAFIARPAIAAPAPAAPTPSGTVVKKAIQLDKADTQTNPGKDKEKKSKTK